MRIGALPACRGGWPVLRRQRYAFKMIAAGACRESARGQKTANLRSKSGEAAISAPIGAREGKCFSDRHGLPKAGFFAGLTPQLTGSNVRSTLMSS